MAISDFAGKAQTVLGLIDPDTLGITLPHEHLIMEHVKANFVEPTHPEDSAMAYKPVCMETLHWLRYHHTQSTDNMNLLDEQEAIDEAMLFKKAGGGTIVDVTNIGISRDPEALVRVSKATGLNVIMGSGYYLATSHPDDMSDKSEDEIVADIVHDVNVGVSNTGIRAGLIGEIGVSWPIHENEAKSLRASAIAQKITGAPLNIHPGRVNNKSALEIIEILSNAGAALTRTVISHIDARVRDQNIRCEIASTGCYMEYDVFGWTGIPPAALYPDADIDVPNDIQRIHEIMQLVERGFIKQILISQDICFKTWRSRYGGHGYAHILNHMVPVMLSKGMTQEQINIIMIDNPKRMLTFC
jgi:phosphotriesterase-related protein